MIDLGCVRGGGAVSTMLPVDCGSAGTSSGGAPWAGSATKSHSVGLASASTAAGSAITAGADISDARRSGDLGMVQSPGFGEGNGLDNASGTATKNTRAPHKEPATRMAEREIWSAEIVARNARIPNPALLSDDPSSPAPRVRPRRCGPGPTSATMVVELDYFGVNRRPAG